MARRQVAAALLLLASAPPPVARGQPFSFEAANSPEPFTLQGHYLFYVDTPKDTFAPGGSKKATVMTKLMLLPDTASASPAALSEVSGYQSMQVALLPLGQFQTFIDPAMFCSYQPNSNVSQLTFRKDAPVQNILHHTVSGDRAAPQEFSLGTTSRYVLLIANCGPLNGLKVVGTVAVQNPHGFLQAPDYNKKLLYAGFLFFYLATLFLWGGCAMSNWNSLLVIQRNLLFVALMGAVECATMWAFYETLNMSNEFNQALFLAGSIVSLWKVCMLFREAILISEVFALLEEAPSAALKLHVLLVAYAGAEFNFRSLSGLRTGYFIEQAIILKSAVPMVLLGIVLFVWGYVALRSEQQALLDQKRDEQAELMRRSRCIVCMAMVGTAAALAMHLLDPGIGDDSTKWSMHCFYSDGVAQTLFAVVLVAVMFLWRPRESIQFERGTTKEVAADNMAECEPIGAAMDEEEGIAPMKLSVDGPAE